MNFLWNGVVAIFFFIFHGRAIAMRDGLRKGSEQAFEKRLSQFWESEEYLKRAAEARKLGAEVDRLTRYYGEPDPNDVLVSRLYAKNVRLIEVFDLWVQKEINDFDKKVKGVNERLEFFEGIVSDRQAFNRVICWPVRWLMPKRA